MAKILTSVVATISRVRRINARFPTSSRSLLIVVLTCATLGITFLLSAPANTQIASGGAITIVVLGLTWLTGWSGQISIGNSGFMAVGGYVVAIWAEHHTSTPLVVSLLFATIAGGASGLIIAIPSGRLRGPYLAGLTLAFATVVPSVVNTFSSWTGGPSGNLFFTALVIPQWFQNLFSGANATLDYTYQWNADLTVVIAGVVFVFMANLFHSPTGRAMRLLRDNDVAAELVGINIARAKTLAFVIAAALGGLGGGLIALQSSLVTQNSFEFPLSIALLTVMVLGGIGTLTGAVLAGVIYAFSGSVVNWLEAQTHISNTSNVGTNMQGIIYAVLLTSAMLVAPAGLWGGALRIKKYLRQRLQRVAPVEQGAVTHV